MHIHFPTQLTRDSLKNTLYVALSWLIENKIEEFYRKRKMCFLRNKN